MATETDQTGILSATGGTQPITPDPMFKVAAVFDTPAEANAAIDELASQGFVDKDIEYFCGEPGEEKFDFSGSSAGTGILARMLRAFRNSTYDRIILDRYEASLRSGNCMLMVYIHKAEHKEIVAQILHHHNAHQVDYFGLAMTEHISEKPEGLEPKEEMF